MANNGPESRDEPPTNFVAALRSNTSDSIDSMGNLYRGEVDRATAWRARLDQTTNWAVVLVAAILTWAFSSPNNPHYVLLIGMLAVAAFLLIEAHRFREYNIWRSRVRLIQKNFFVGMLSARSATNENWQEELGESLATPTISVSWWDAIGHRLRRMYLPLLLLLLVAWLARITVFHTAEPWRQSASIPGLDGETIVLVVAVAYVLFSGIALWSAIGAKPVELQK